MNKKIVSLVAILLVLVGGLIIEKKLSNDKKDFNPNITVSIKLNQSITSPLQISGKARGFWFFEASFPIKLIDKNNNVLATTIAQAKGDPATGEVNWMTEGFVDFEAELKFASGRGQKGFIVFDRDNPSGLPENDEEFKLPIIIE